MPSVNRWAEHHHGLRDCYFEPMVMKRNFIKKIRQTVQFYLLPGLLGRRCFFMTNENRIVTKITEPGVSPAFIKPRMTEEQLKNDYKYCMAQKLLKRMLERGLITVDEFDKITEKNRKTFSPYLVEIMS
nr:MAG TPA: Short C-terminal domain [Caudoviricetes sp.]